jgi:hypothetical protein
MEDPLILHRRTKLLTGAAAPDRCAYVRLLGLFMMAEDYTPTLFEAMLLKQYLAGYIGLVEMREYLAAEQLQAEDPVGFSRLPQHQLLALDSSWPVVSRPK